MNHVCSPNNEHASPNGIDEETTVMPEPGSMKHAEVAATVRHAGKHPAPVTG